MINAENLTTCLAALAISVLSFSAFSAETVRPNGSVYSADEQIWKAAENVYAYGRQGYFSMFVVTSAGVIVTDPMNSEHSRGLLAAIKEVTNQPIRYLLISHNHWDHAGGGQVFKNVGATLVAHEEAKEWMKANPHPDMALPDETWAGKENVISLGDSIIELKYVGMSHGLGMSVVLLPDRKILYIADLVVKKRIKFSIMADFYIDDYKKALVEIEQLNFDLAIFSHAPMQDPFGSKSDVKENREYIEALETAVLAEFDKGTHFTEIPYVVALPNYEDWGGYEKWLPLNAWRITMEVLMGPFPSVPTSPVASHN